MDLYLNRLLRCLILYLSSSLLVCCIFTTDSNQEMIPCFFPHYLMTQDSCHFPLQGCISFISYNGIPLNLSMKCLLQFVLLQFCLFLQKPCGLHRKPVTGLLWKNWALFIHSGLFMKNYLLRKAFLYKLTQTFLLSVAVKIVY